MRSSLIASTSSGNTVPSSTTNANTANSTLLARNAASRDNGESMRPGRTQAVAAPRDQPDRDGHDQRRRSRGSTGRSRYSVNAWTESSTPERVMKVPRIVRENVAHSNDRFQTRNIPRRSCTITECR